MPQNQRCEIYRDDSRVCFCVLAKGDVISSVPYLDASGHSNGMNAASTQIYRLDAIQPTGGVGLVA